MRKILSKIKQLYRRIRPKKDIYAKLKNDDLCVKVPFPCEPNDNLPHASIAVICHMFYTDLAEEFKQYFMNIPYPFDLYITTDTAEKKSYLEEKFSSWSKGKVDIRIALNRGRDIAPKLITCRDVYEHYEFVLHVHSKKSVHSKKLNQWREYLMDTLLGSREIIISIMELFRNNPKLGMIAPQHYHVIKFWDLWGENYENILRLAKKIGIRNIRRDNFDFPSGSMFWARSIALKPLLDCSLSFDDFQDENNQTDGTLAHAIERIYFFVCEKAGYQWIKIITDEGKM